MEIRGTAMLVIAGLAGTGVALEAQASPPLEVWTLSERVRLGNEEPATMLTFVVDVFSPGPDLFVVEGQPARVLQYTRDGSFVRSIGRPGPGPGEFRLPWAAGRLQDSLWVADGGGREVELFHDGEPARAALVWAEVGSPHQSFATPEGVFSDGSVLLGPGGLGVTRINDGATTRSLYLRATATGQIIDTLADLAIPGTDFYRGEILSGFPSEGQQPLPHRPIVKLLPGGDGLMWLGRSPPTDAQSGSYEFVRLDLTGAVVQRTTIPVTPREVTGAWRDSWVESHATRLRGAFGAERPVSPDIGTTLHFPAFFPAATDFTPVHDGSVWVRREQAGEGPTLFDVINPSGERIARVEGPAGLQIHEVLPDGVWGLLTDDLDVPYVIFYDVVRPAG